MYKYVYHSMNVHMSYYPRLREYLVDEVIPDSITKNCPEYVEKLCQEFYNSIKHLDVKYSEEPPNEYDAYYNLIGGEELSDKCSDFIYALTPTPLTDLGTDNYSDCEQEVIRDMVTDIATIMGAYDEMDSE